MAASAIDEAIRNCVAVGADPRRIAILDNFCWGYTDRPETLGSLVRAALACHDLAVVLQTPFISGKDSLNNEFSYADADGRKRTISIPPSLLISAMGQVDDVSRCVTMDAKEPGNLIYLVGVTKAELGGSHLSLVEGLSGGQVPTVDVLAAKRTFAAVHAAIAAGSVRACHDLSEGGLAAAAAETAFAGGLGMSLRLADVPRDFRANSADAVAGAELDAYLLFSESNTRFLCEVPPAARERFEQSLDGVPHAVVGRTESGSRLQIAGTDTAGTLVIDAQLADLKEAWQKPLRW
jgi:phosphoribosylformylglycinamidine synthase